MATEKQARLIVKLAIQTGRITPARAAETEAQYLPLSPEKTRGLIDALNAELGFDRGLSPATTRQRAFILDLEERVLGRWETTHQTKISYNDADERIKYLKKLEAAQKPRPAAPIAAPGVVIGLFTRKAV